MFGSMFSTKTIKQGRTTTATGWGVPTLDYLTSFDASPQPFTGDDHFINDQYAQGVRDLIVIYDTTFDIKFDDRLYYNNKLSQVVYVQLFDMGVIPHLEVYVSDCQGEIPAWAV